MFLRHRIILTYEAEAEEMSSDDVIDRLFESIEGAIKIWTHMI